ncbi:MAG: formylglycine-generating enzyme family protein [Desulfobacterales bacterium]|nr:formylglycine-generating enzyme family protein [Desulfobacterales bacterium]
MNKLILMFCLSMFIIPDYSFAYRKPSYKNSIGMQFVFIKPGNFKMGSPENELYRKRNEKLHTVKISRGFFISITEVTQEQFLKVMKYNPSAFISCGKNCPVERVTWHQAQNFIKKLNMMESTDKYRLPTEAEWEYVCRAGTTTAFSSGKITEITEKKYCALIENLKNTAWYCGNSGKRDPVADLKSHPVKKKKPNKWGLYDMHGNVAEWVLDSCRWKSWTGLVAVDTDTYKDGIVDPLSKSGDRKIFRGGSWNQGVQYLRSASRGYYRPKAYRNNIGFRIVKMK